MQVAYAVLLFVAVLFQSDADADVNCKLPTPVEKFVSSYYTALMVGNDPDIVDTLTVSGDEAAMLYLSFAQKALDVYNYRKCDAAENTFVSSIALTFFGNLTLPIYFKSVAQNVGSILYQFGVLDCNNAVPLALEYLKYNREDAEEYKLDPHKFVTYMHEVVFGGYRLYTAHGLKLETALSPTADVFYRLSTEYTKKKPNCVR